MEKTSSKDNKKHIKTVVIGGVGSIIIFCIGYRTGFNASREYFTRGLEYVFNNVPEFKQQMADAMLKTMEIEMKK